MSPEEFLYLRSRAMVERQRAAEASDPSVRERHLSLAEMYEMRLKGDDAGLRGNLPEVLAHSDLSA
jgi:hypothetical protein